MLFVCPFLAISDETSWRHAPPFYSKVPIVLEDGFDVDSFNRLDPNCYVISAVSLVIYTSKSESFWNEKFYKNLLSLMVLMVIYGKVSC